MGHKGFCIAYFGTFLMLVGVIGFALALVDPLGLSPIGMTSEGWTKTKVARDVSDRLYRTYDPLVQSPQIVLLGTSRFNQSIDIDFLDTLTGKRSYVAGLNGGTPSELADLLDFWLHMDVPIETVVVEIYYWRLIPRPDNTVPPHIVSPLDDLIRVFLSSQSFVEALDTLLYNRLALERPHFSTTGERRPSFAAGGRQMGNGMEKWWRKAVSLTQPVSDDDVKPLERIVSICASYKLSCHFVISPIHPFRLAIFERVGLLLYLESMKRAVAGLGEVWDFTRANHFTFHSMCEGSSAWFDPGHFSRETGRDIAAAVFRQSEPARNYWRLLKPDTLEQSIVEWRQEIVDWINANPGFGKGPSPYVLLGHCISSGHGCSHSGPRNRYPNPVGLGGSRDHTLIFSQPLPS